MSRKTFMTILLLGLAGLFQPGQAEAGGWMEKLEDSLQRIAAPAAEEREDVRYSLDQAVSKVRREFGGKVIRAETRYNGRPVHHIKLLTREGHVRTVRVDGRSGRIL